MVGKNALWGPYYFTFRNASLLWCLLSPVAAFLFVAIVPSSYLAGVIACVSDERLAPSFRRHLARQTAPGFLVVLLVFLSPALASRGCVREPFIRIVQVALGLGLTIFSFHAFLLRLLNIPKQAEVIDFVL